MKTIALLVIALIAGCAGSTPEGFSEFPDSEDGAFHTGSAGTEYFETAGTEAYDTAGSGSVHDAFDPETSDGEVVEPDAGDTYETPDAGVPEERVDSGAADSEYPDTGAGYDASEADAAEVDSGEDAAGDSSEPDTEPPCTCFEDSDCCDGCYPINVGLSCSDGLYCNGSEICDAVGSCEAGEAPNCNDGIGCTVDTCNEITDSCDHDPNDSACDDGLYCNGTDSCSVVEGCVHSGDPCAGGETCNDHCNEADDTCFSPEDQSCDDGDICTQSDACDGEGGCAGELFCIYDEETDIMWEYPPNLEPENYPIAESYCANLELGGYTDWRLPTFNEAMSIFYGYTPVHENTCSYREAFMSNYSCYWKSEHNVPIHPNLPTVLQYLCHHTEVGTIWSYRFWTSSKCVDPNVPADARWGFNYHTGDISINGGSGYTRCVR